MPLTVRYILNGTGIERRNQRCMIFKNCKRTFCFINSWNEYVWPVLILKSKENYTLSLALQMYISAEGGTEFTIAMAVSVITMIIPLALYLIFQRYIINTFAASGVKG